MKISRCLICNTDFIQKTSIQDTCSKDCRKKLNQGFIWPDNINLKRYNHTCGECKKQFTNEKSIAKYCSKECFYKSTKNTRKWIKNPNYRNWTRVDGKMVLEKGMSQWKKLRQQIVKEMEEQFGYVYCQRCWTSNSLKWELHHIIFRSEARNHEKLHIRENAIFCCIKCHNNYHSQKNIRNQLVKDRGLDKIFGSQVILPE